MTAIEFASRSGQQYTGILALICAYNLHEKATSRLPIVN